MIRITHHWIIWNKKKKELLLVHKFLQVTLPSFFLLIFLFFTTFRSQNTDFSLKKSEILLFYNKLKFKKTKTRKRYLVIYVKKNCVKFQKDWCSGFWAREFTDSEKAKCEKNAFKSLKDLYTTKPMFFSILTQNHRSQLHKAKGFQLWCLEHQCCKKLKINKKNTRQKLPAETYKLMKYFWWDLQLHISVSFTPIDFKFSQNNLNMLYINIRK